MGRFLFGFLLGGATVFFSLHYHVVRAEDGVQFVPKVTSTFSETYVDIRSYGLGDWMEHPNLALALERDGKSELLRGAAKQSIGNAVEGVLDSAFGNQ